MQSQQRCSHGCYLPSGESTARDLNGRDYCTGCECRGGAFVLADGHVHGFDRTPIYDDHFYCDVTGNEEWYKASRYPAQPETIQDRLDEVDPDFRNGALVDDTYCHLGASSHGEAAMVFDESPTGRFLPTACQLASLAEMSAKKIEQAEITNPKKKWFPVEVPAEWRKLKPFAASTWSFTPWVKPTFDVIPLGLLPIKREQVGYTGENGTSGTELAKPLTNFCPRCFTRNPITEHTEGGFVPERGELMRKVMSEDAPGDWFFRVRGEKLDNKWVTNRVFTRQEIRCGLHVPQTHACGERADA